MSVSNAEKNAVWTAILTAAAAPALVYLIVLLFLKPGYFAFLFSFWVFLIALAHAVILGLPAFVLVKKLNFISWLASLLIGYIIGWLPYTLYACVRNPSDISFEGFFYAAAGLGIIGALSALTGWLVWWKMYGRHVAQSKS